MNLRSKLSKLYTYLQRIATYFKLSTTTTARKDKLCKMVMEYLVNEELVPEESIEDLSSRTVDNSAC